MKILVAEKQRDHFLAHQHVAFEELLTQKQLAAINSSLDRALASRLGVAPSAVWQQPEAKLFLSGRECWRSDEDLQRWVCLPLLGRLVADAIRRRPLRLAYDQLFQSTQERPWKAEQQQVLEDFLSMPNSLDATSCCQGLAAGLFLRLTPPSSEEGESDPYLRAAGDGLLVGPSFPVNFSQFYRLKNQRYLLIAYADHQARYICRKEDPHVHDWKQMGYAFGDKLTQPFHPLIMA